MKKKKKEILFAGWTVRRVLIWYFEHASISGTCSSVNLERQETKKSTKQTESSSLAHVCDIKKSLEKLDILLYKAIETAFTRPDLQREMRERRWTREFAQGMCQLGDIFRKEGIID
jgi:hypothetical protein